MMNDFDAEAIAGAINHLEDGIYMKLISPEEVKLLSPVTTYEPDGKYVVYCYQLNNITIMVKYDSETGNCSTKHISW